MCKVYGYCRVSTTSQKLDRQIKVIRNEYPDAIIFSEKYTGSTLNRPEWNRLMSKVTSGDTIVFEDVSRFSRDDAEEAFKLYEELYNAGIKLVFISKPHLNTDSYKEMGCTLKNEYISGDDINGEILNESIAFINKVLFMVRRQQFMAAFDQSYQELVNIRKNIKQGMEVARDKGKQIGHKKESTYVTNRERVAIRIINENIDKGLKKREMKDLISKAFERELGYLKCHNISDVTYYKYRQKALGIEPRHYNKSDKQGNK